MPLRIFLTWVLIMTVEVAHGVLRRLFVAPWLGEHLADQWGVLVAAALAMIVAIATARWIGARTTRSLLLIGLVWSILTVLFEVGLARVLGVDPSRLAASYDLLRGGLMPLGLLAMVFTPLAAARVRRLWSSRRPRSLRMSEALPCPANDDG